jgi:hypothetical protein
MHQAPYAAVLCLPLPAWRMHGASLYSVMPEHAYACPAGTANLGRGQARYISSASLASWRRTIRCLQNSACLPLSYRATKFRANKPQIFARWAVVAALARIRHEIRCGMIMSALLPRQTVGEFIVTAVADQPSQGSSASSPYQVQV